MTGETEQDYLPATTLTLHLTLNTFILLYTDQGRIQHVEITAHLNHS